MSQQRRASTEARRSARSLAASVSATDHDHIE